MEGKKFIVGLCGFVVLLLLGGVYKAVIYDDKIVVSLPSDVCAAATLRVTKDDFTLKCGRRIAFQADTITEYYKTYGTDEWVRNNRFVGLNKKHITLELNDYGNYFDIVRKTRYRKGRQNIDDGVLYETYTFTKDKVKITYDYQVNNKALHRVSMRIKKQVDSYLDAYDPFGHTAVQQGNIVYYEGYGNMLIDPSITLHSPAAATIQFNEGDVVPFKCSVNQTNDSTLNSVKLWWNADNETLWESNGSVTISGNSTVTFSRIIPHPITPTFLGYFNWTCEGINTTCTSNDNCTFGANTTIDPRYAPESPTIVTPNDVDINLLNGSGWGMHVHYPGLGNFSGGVTPNQSIWVNWTIPVFRDNTSGDIGVVWNLSYFGTLDTTRKYDNFFNWNSTINITDHAEWNVSKLAADSYFITLIACNGLNATLCANTTTTVPVDIFDYDIDISTGESEIRFSPMPTYTLRPALGQTASQGIIAVDWLGSGAPDGQINLSINHTEADKCMDIYAYLSNNVSAAVQLVNNSYVTALNVTDSDPDYIWLWATKASCGTTTTDFSFDLDLFFGGT